MAASGESVKDLHISLTFFDELRGVWPVIAKPGITLAIGVL